MQKRYAFFYLIGTLCNGLSGVIAYGIQQMVSKERKSTRKMSQITNPGYRLAWLTWAAGDGFSS